MLKNQNGNALWFILITVALFAALTAMLSRNSSSVNQAGNVEQNRIKAAALLRYSKSIETAIQQMMLNGVSENDLDFIAIGASHNNTNCNSNECEVFGTKGGGVNYRTPAVILNDSTTGGWHVSTGNRVYQIGCSDNNNSCTDLLLLFPNIPKEICLQVNSIMGITNPNNDAPQISEIVQGTAYTGTYSTTVNAHMFGGTNVTNDAPQVRGKTAGCVFEFGGGQDTYHFYQVLVSR